MALPIGGESPSVMCLDEGFQVGERHRPVDPKERMFIGLHAGSKAF